MKLSLIAAIGQQNELGKDNKMAWHYPEDLSFFKEKTLHGTVIMGRKTWHSLPVKPLFDRTNIVITQNKGGQVTHDNWQFFTIESCMKWLWEYRKEGNVFFIGGAQIYTQALQMPELQTCYITRIPETVKDADTFFPMHLLVENFILSQSREQVASNGKTLVFETWERKTF